MGWSTNVAKAKAPKAHAIGVFCGFYSTLAR